jgi:type I site-specific restriction endonuclease
MIEQVIDYAHPMMMVEKAMKKAHDYLLEEDYILALDQINLAIVEARNTRISIIHIMEKQDALRDQTAPI